MEGKAVRIRDFDYGNHILILLNVHIGLVNGNSARQTVHGIQLSEGM